MINLCINGAAGRMGRELVELASDSPDFTLVSALEHSGSPAIGQVIGGCNITSDTKIALKTAQVVIDFSAPQATLDLCELAGAAGTAMVIGTTGISREQEKVIRAAANRIPIIYSGNYSLGVNVLATLVERAAAALPAELFDLEIFESHHSAKVDAPSGTALLLGRAGAAGRGENLDAVKVTARDGHTGPRPRGAIGFAALRGGDVAGDHTVFFYGQQERLELRHQATDRAIFARGALHAARWVTGKAPGLYNMQDVLGLK